jgi:hypothetical protein
MESWFVEARVTSRTAWAQEQSRNGQYSCGNPNPEEFTSDNGRPAIREKSSDTNRGYTNWSPWKKVTVVVERREERDTEAPIRHGIQETVTCGCQKEICPYRQSADIWQPASKSQEHNGTRQHSGKNKGVSEPSVSPKVTVSDAEPESDYIDVRKNRAYCAYHPNAFWNAGLVKTRSESKGCYRV